MVTFKRKRRTKAEMEAARILKEETLAIPLVEENNASEVKFGGLRDTIEGWINVQRHKFRKHIGYYTGGDIHPTIDQAKKVSTENTIGQVFISLENKK